MIYTKKNYNSIYEYFDAIIFYQDNIDRKGQELLLLTERAYYSINNLLYSTEKFFLDKGVELQTKEVYAFVGSNKHQVLQEKIYYNIDRKIVISIATDISNIREDIDYILKNSELSKDDKSNLDSLVEQAVSDKIKCSIQVAACFKEQELVSSFLKQVASSIKNSPKIPNELGIITQQEYGLELDSFEVKKVTVDIETNYNDDFKEISAHVIKTLNSSTNGIVLFHGIKGSGKTSYIRHLTGIIKNKKIIYVPPDIANNIADPSFISFFIKYPNSIIIIEDAENILKTRKAGGNQAVSNLLNLSDGLLGDVLNLQIICTFNTELEQIDDAIKRPGRLIAEYKFDKLNINKGQLLANKLFPNKNIKIEKDMTLAEIYNIEKKYYNKETNNSIGFFSHKTN